MSPEQFSEALRKRVLVLDGAMGTLIQAEKERGTQLHECYDYLTLANPGLIRSFHKAYVDAGVDIIETNTFGANSLKLMNYGLGDKAKEINAGAVRLAREAIADSGRTGTCLVAGSVGPIGSYLEPFSKTSFDQAYEAFTEQITALAGADVILIETIADIRVAKAAVIAAKDAVDLPIICSMTFEGERTATGTDIESFVTVAEALGVCAIGINCGKGPKESRGLVSELLRHCTLPVVVYTNAGVPRLVEGRTVFSTSPEEFAGYANEFVRQGVNIIGGCCGTTPAHMRAVVEAVRGLRPGARMRQDSLRLCSRTKTLRVDNGKRGADALVIGERINPTNRKSLALEIADSKTRLILQEASKQVAHGASLLDVNVGLPGIDEAKVLAKAVSALQNHVNVPLVLDCSDPAALESALKQADGKVLINSISAESAKLPLLDIAKKYGAAVIALTMDDGGIPGSAEGRVRIAESIVRHAKRIGFPAKDIVFDTLTMSVAVDRNNADITLEALKALAERGFATTLGISNVSHGLPGRKEINARFLAQAKDAGLTFAIMNPEHLGCAADGGPVWSAETGGEAVDYSALPLDGQLRHAIFHGDCDNILPLVETALGQIDPLKINDLLVSALEEVGAGFKEKKIFLPQVLLSAHAMKLSLDRLKLEMVSDKGKPRGRIVFATVKDDLHDIGKNIVSALLESHDYDIIDLGKNVSPETILANARDADIIGLSALMTTTAREMEKTVRFLRANGIGAPIMVGGAVITEDYARSIGCHYSENAVDTVTLVHRLLKERRGSPA